MASDLETAIKGKVTPLVGQTLERTIGVKIPQITSDITDSLLNPQLGIYIALDLPFKEAKKSFKKEFLRRELSLHLGNVSELARDVGLDRRSIHRVIKDLDINIDQVRKQHDPHVYKEDLVDSAIRSTLEQYRGILQPERIEETYREVPKLSRNIARFLPDPKRTWKEAERDFERQFLTHHLEESKGNVALAADKIKIRTETLHRKLKSLHLR